MFEHLAARHAVGLRQQRQVVLDQPRRQGGGGAAEHVVAGEQHEGAAVGAGHVAADHFQAGQFVRLFVGGVGHAVDQDQLHLALVVERAAEAQAIGLGQADAGFEVVEGTVVARPPGRARG